MGSRAVFPGQLLPSSCFLSLRAWAGSLVVSLHSKAWQQIDIEFELLPDACKVSFMSGRWCVLLTINYNFLELLTNLPTLCPLTYLHRAYFTHPAITAAVSGRKPSEKKQVSPCSIHTQMCTHMLHIRGDQCSVLKQPQGSTAITGRWARGWAPPAVHRGWYSTLPQHPATLPLNPLLLGSEYPALVSWSYDWVV